MKKEKKEFLRLKKLRIPIKIFSLNDAIQKFPQGNKKRPKKKQKRKKEEKQKRKERQEVSLKAENPILIAVKLKDRL